MKLYFKTGACSLSPHIVLEEAGLAYDAESVDLATKKTASGDDYFTVNPKGYVPALVLDDGQVLTEGPAIVQYLADRVPEKKLAPPAGSIERYRLMELLNFISTEFHKALGSLFNPKMPEDWRKNIKQILNKRLEVIAKELDGRDYLMGADFTVADAYLFTVLSWAPALQVDLSPWPALGAYLARVAQRPAVQKAMIAEGQRKP